MEKCFKRVIFTTNYQVQWSDWWTNSFELQKRKGLTDAFDSKKTSRLINIKETVNKSYCRRSGNLSAVMGSTPVLRTKEEEEEAINAVGDQIFLKMRSWRETPTLFIA